MLPIQPFSIRVSAHFERFSEEIGRAHDAQKYVEAARIVQPLVEEVPALRNREGEWSDDRLPRSACSEVAVANRVRATFRRCARSGHNHASSAVVIPYFKVRERVTAMIEGDGGRLTDISSGSTFPAL